MKHIFYILLVVLAYGPVRAYAGKTGKTECHTGFGDAEIPRRCGVCGKPL